MTRGHVLAVVGAQLGSEGKGSIVAKIANDYDVHIRTGAPNAGHTIYHNGQKHVMQVIPCGWVNPNATIILGRGMLISPEILERELEEISKVDPTIRTRLWIDSRAGVLDDKFHKAEGGIHGEIHKRIGSTGEGVGVARVARMNRVDGEFRFMGDLKTGTFRGLLHDNTPELIASMLKKGSNVLLEGTQGCGLSLIHGPWPYVTSGDTNAAQLAADAGIPPRYVDKTIIVARTYPIRVFGNSGPLKGELTWEEMSRRVGYELEERTTVTKKVRRIGEWDWDLIDNAVTLNGPTSVALTFSDYLDPDYAGVTEPHLLGPNATDLIRQIGARYNLPVSMVGTGGEGCQVAMTGSNL